MKKLYFLALMTLSTFAFPQMIASYDFNGNANDVSGNGHHGTVNGATLTTDRSGNANSAYLFNGVSDDISLGNLVLNSSHISIGFWCQRSAVDLNWHAVVSQGVASTDQGLHMGLTGTIPGQQNIGFDLFNDGVYDSTGASSTGWNHWFVTYDYGNYNTNIYLNGQLIKNVNLTGYYNGSGNVTIGSTSWGGNYFDGSIDEVMIYGQLLNAGQVDSIYQSQKPACAPFGLSSNISDVSCHATSNGGVLVYSSAGIPPFTFAWSGGQNSNPATGLSGGNYTVVVTDAVGCKDSLSMFVNEPSQITAVMSSTMTSCNSGNDGAAEAQIAGGIPPYTYGWPPLNEFNSVITGYSAGSYTCNITDANGCMIIDTVSILQPGPFNANMTVTSGTVCQGEPDTLSVSVSGGAAPSWYEWHDFTAGHTDTTLNASFVIEPVSTGSTVAGVYVYDALGCYTYTSGMFWTNMADSLSGHVTEPNSNPVITHAQVYLIKQKQSHVGLGDTLGAVSVNSSGYFTAPGLFWGDYFLKVVADSFYYPTSIPTYYSNNPYPFQWDSALVIQHHTCIGVNDTGKNVTIIEITPPTGHGTISGQITSVPGFGQRYGNGGLSPMGAPLKGVDVKLGRNPGGSPAARTTTDYTTGIYTFTNVDTGSYKIYVDIPNYGMDSARVVEITTIDTVSMKNDYYVDSTMVHVVPHYYINSVQSICSGDSVFAGGAYQGIAGTYYDNLLTTMGGDSIIETDLTVNMLPNVTASTSSDTICSGGSVALTAGGALNYSWTGGVIDGTPFSPTATDTYTVTGTDGNGCTASATITVVVKSCVGINSYNLSGLSAYPNPSTSMLTVSSSTVPLFIQVQNVAGEKLMDAAVTGNSTQVDISKLAAGAYFVKVQLSKEGAQYIKIVKQ